MNRLKITLCFFSFFLLSVNCRSQINAAHKTTIKNQLLKRINELRQEVGVDLLTLDQKLAKPSEVHSTYMAKTNKLSHSHNIVKFNTPFKRVEHFSPIAFDVVGENILLSKPVKFPLHEKAAIVLANDMFEAWKNSPGHYANMIELEFNSCNFGFKLALNNQMYATNVFGRKGIKIGNQLSKNAFNLKDGKNEDCFPDQEYHSNILVNIGNSVSINGNDIVLYHHDKEHFVDLFSEVNDGIAIDIIDKEQFPCEARNRLDISRIYDGVLLKPAYRNEIIKNNTAKSDYRLVSKIGTVPDSLIGKDITFSVLLIKNGAVCKTVIPSYVPRAAYPLKPIVPKLDNSENVTLTDRNSIESLSLSFQFNTNKTTPISFPEIPIKKENILAVKIKSYSSIDGSEEYNIQLHKNRAKVIKDYILKSVNIKKDIFKIETKENWDEFNFQLKLCFSDSLLSRSKQELREMASSKNIEALPWDSLLSEQRKSSATFYYESSNKDKASQHTLFINNLKYAIVENNIELANKALSEMYYNEMVDSNQIFDEAVFEFLMNEPRLTQNTAAILTKCHKDNLEQTIRFINKWLTNEPALNEDTKFNLLTLYTIVNNKLLSRWDLPSQRLANVIDPRYINQILNSNYSNELMLNIHLTFIKYYGQINDGVNISKSFKFISNYFESRALEIEDGIALCKFYNRWSRYDLTIQYLLSRYDDDKLNGEALFLLVETMNHYSEEGDVLDRDKIYLKAIDQNKKKWCHWVDNNIQLIRDRKLKNMYCKKCLQQERSNGHGHSDR